MIDYKREFIEFMIASDVLCFGDFTTKSGRQTPYFINTGRYDSGKKLSQLGKFYAKALREEIGDQFDCLFGPAYKGIPLASVTSYALMSEYERDVKISFNRKEAKDHGEGGILVGHKITEADEVVIIEDVITAGTAIREVLPILQQYTNKINALVVSVDRKEKGQSELSAIDEVQKEYGIKTFAIVSIDDIIEFLEEKDEYSDDLLEKVKAYRAQYGV